MRENIEKNIEISECLKIEINLLNTKFRYICKCKCMENY